MFTSEPTAACRHIKRGTQNPRLEPEVASCSIVEGLSRPPPLKSALPRKPGASAKRPNYFPRDLHAMMPSAEPAKPRPAHI
jgi:hypothetical protein